MSEKDVEFIAEFDAYPELLPSKPGIYIGAHLSLDYIFSDMKDLNASGAAFFVSQPYSWQINLKQLQQKAATFYTQASRDGLYREQFLPHGPYLMNIISLQERVREASVKRLVVEMFVVRSMGLSRLNIHPGVGDCDNFYRLAEAINTAHSIVPDVVVVLETMAGNKQNSAYGCTFQQLKQIIEAVVDKERIGVCIDTYHTFAGAYVPVDNFAKTLLDTFDTEIGRYFLYGFHVNNSLTEHGSRVDRHAPLSDGKMDIKEFAALMQLQIQSVYCLETPNPNKWKDEVAFLYAAAAQSQ